MMILKGFCIRFQAMCLLLILAPSVVLSQSPAVDPAVSTIRDVLERTQPDIAIESIVPSPVAGLYEVSIQNGEVVYASADGEFFLYGELFQYQPAADGLVNINEQKRNAWRKEQIAAIDESEMIVYEAKGERKAVLTVFTDVDCPYCRRLHGEVPDLNDMGIAVRYLAFPRTGLNTETHERMISTWCSENPQATMTSAKRGGTIPEASCENPVARQYQLGRTVGVTGTPALVMENGSIVPGYVPADVLGPFLLGETE